MDFIKTKEFILDFAIECNACSDEKKRVENSEDFETLIQVVNDNIGWVSGKQLFNQVSIREYFPQDLIDKYELGMGVDNIGFKNSGYRNSGDRNSGNWNSGNWNSGDRNSGYRNSGYRNSGDNNSGYRNSGDNNSGNWNSGYRNSGDSNSGYRNSGYRNSGYRNSGDSNSGDRNSGNWNSGNWNSGDRNSGDSNSGYRNSGAFCTEVNPTLVLFDKPTNILVKDWEQGEVCRMMYNIDPTVFVQSEIMTDKEKEEHPKHETIGGYLKTIPMHEAWANFWGNLPQEKRQLFLDLPNFDAGKFKEITGIDVSK